MPILRRTTFIRAPLPEVFTFFSDPQNLARITPEKMGFEIVAAPDRSLRAGDRIEYRIRILGVPLRWTTLITRWEENVAFADLQERGPYRRWLHTHSFRAVDGGVEMGDVVEYELPLGLLGRLAAGWMVRRQLRTIFDHRAAAIEGYFRA